MILPGSEISSDNEMIYFPISSAIILHIFGPDAPRYLQSRLTNDINSLEIGNNLLAATLSPQGKTEGLFRVLRAADDGFILYCDNGNKDSLLETVKRYIVADQVTVEDKSEDLKVIHAANSSLEKKEFEGVYRISAKRGIDNGYDFLFQTNQQQTILEFLQAASATEISTTQQEYLRMAAGIPTFPPELNDRYLFAEAGLNEAISYDKGCYVGQEVIEKVASHAKVPNILVHLKLPEKTSLSVGDKVCTDQNGDKVTIGKVISFTKNTDNEPVYCFARVKNLDNLDTSQITVA